MLSKVSRNTVVPLAVASAAFVIGAIAIWMIASLQLYQVLVSQKSYVLQRIGQELGQRDILLQTFKARAGQGCSDDLLKDLRRTLFTNDSIRDAAILGEDGNEIRCTALLGNLATPVVLAPEKALPTPRPDMSVWINPDGLGYEGMQKFVLFKEGPLAIISYPTWPSDLPAHRGWAITATVPGGTAELTTLGRDGISREYHRTRWNPLTSLLHLRSCELENGIVCLYLKAAVGELIASEWLLLAMGMLVNTTMTLLIFLQLRSFLLRRNSPGNRIRRSIRAGGPQIRCVYQPIFDLRSDSLSGCEVLARFEDELGTLLPAEFIPEVERQKLTWEFTEIVLSRALGDLEPVLEKHPELRVAINFFPGDLDDINVDRLSACKPLRWAANRKFQLCCEILETGILEPDHMRKVHAFLERCGFLVAIDDFGAGYSNISQVSEGHVDLLKIDKSFIQELDRELPAMRAALVGPMIAIARSIGADVVAEGIETETQLAQIKSLKIHYGQGFLLSRPLPIDAFRRLAQAEKDKVPATVVNLTLP